MNTNGNFTIDETLYLDPKILAEALNLFQQLISWVDNDVFPMRLNGLRVLPERKRPCFWPTGS
jgi:hypothetical protein